MGWPSAWCSKFWNAAADSDGVSTRAGKTASAPATVRSRQVGPSRVDNVRQKRIAELIDGYESTVTLSSITRNVLFTWLLPATAMMYLAYAERAPVEAEPVQADRLRFGAQYASFLLLVATCALIAIWTMRSWSNQNRTGPRPSLGMWSRVRRHIPGMIPVLIGVLLRPLIGDQWGIVTPMIGIGLVWVVSLVPLLLVDIYRMIWQRSASPDSGSADMPPLAVFFNLALGLAVTLIVLDELVIGSSSSSDIVGLLAEGRWLVRGLQGLSMAVAAVSGAQLIVLVGRRQDARLVYIVESSASSPIGKSSVVTEQQVLLAWQESESLLDFDH